MTDLSTNIRNIFRHAIVALLLVFVIGTVQPALAQKVRSLDRLTTLADTLIAHQRYQEAFRLCDSALNVPKLNSPATYRRAAESGLGLLSAKKSDYSEITRFMDVLADYALKSEDKEFVISTFRTIIDFCLEEYLTHIGINYCDVAERYADGGDSLSLDFRGFLDYARGDAYADLRDMAASVACFKKSVSDYERTHNYGMALLACERVLYSSPKIGTSTYSMDFWNYNMDKLYIQAREHQQISDKMSEYYYIAKSGYYKYVGKHSEALAAWDSSIVFHKRRTVPGNPMFKPRNIECFNNSYRIDYLSKLGREDEIERIAEFSTDTTDIVPDDMACLQYLLGKHYGEKHQYDKAFHYLKKSYLTYRGACGDNSPLTLKTLLLLLRYSIASGNYDYGLEIAGKGIATMPNVFNTKESNSALELMEQTSVVELLSHRRDSLEKHMIEAERIFSRMLTRNFGYLNDIEFNDLWSRADISCSHLLQMTSELDNISPSLSNAIYRSVLTQKTLYFVSQNHLKQSAESSPEKQHLYNSISMLRKIISEKRNDLPSNIIDSLYREAMRQEALLFANDTVQNYLKNLLAANHESVRRNLSDGDVVVEFSEVFDYDDDMRNVFPDRCTYPYLAVAFDKQCDAPIVIILFDRDSLADHILSNGATLSDALKRRTPDDIRAIYSDTLLTRMVWGKIMGRFPDAKAIYFSPTGCLNGLAMENMMMSDGQTMSQKYKMQRIFSSAFFEGAHARPQYNDIALFGGIRYDCPTEWPDEIPSNITRSQDTYYQYLPSTYEECDYIKSRLCDTIKAYFHSGCDATETSFKDYSGHSPSILHIATHGYFNPQDSSANLLNMSGLVFARANDKVSTAESDSHADNGILTANEISELDLSNTNLAVLSACETGLGYVNSDGLFGLLRGFKLAGVHNVVISLWNVSDDATSLFMRKFYSYLLHGHTSHESLDYARDYLRTGNRFSHPYYWAGFVLVE